MGSKIFSNFKFTNKVISIILLSIFLILLIYTYNMDWSQKTARDGITAGFFPKAILILSMIFCIGMAVNTYSNEVPESLEEFDFKNLIYVVISLFICWGYFLLLLELGFFISSFLFLSLSIYFLGPGSWKVSLITTLIIIVFVYTFFSLIQVPSNIF